MRILFLGIDGVLHPLEDSNNQAGWLRWLPTLESLIDTAPDVRVVVHSAWRYMYTDEKLRTLLRGLGHRFVGSTPHGPRGQAIEMVLQANRGAVDSHLVLDHDPREFSAGGLNLVLCDPQRGISAPVTQAAIATWLRTTAPVAASPLGARLPRGSGAPVLYLDFDGVLHHENVLWHPRRGVFAGPPGFELFEHAALLDELLRPYPAVRIVLSTSWVREVGYSRSVKRLPPGLQARVVGATFHSEMDKVLFSQKTRGRQVIEDVARRRPRGWLALDDTDEGWPSETRRHVLLTDEQMGIGESGMRERIAAALAHLAAA